MTEDHNRWQLDTYAAVVMGRAPETYSVHLREEVRQLSSRGWTQGAPEYFEVDQRQSDDDDMPPQVGVHLELVSMLRNDSVPISVERDALADAVRFVEFLASFCNRFGATFSVYVNGDSIAEIDPGACGDRAILDIWIDPWREFLENIEETS